jgi:hypothetical protein
MLAAWNDVRALRHHHRQVRAHLLDVAKGMQELAAELDRFVLAVAGRLTRASPSSCTSLPSPLASARRAVATVTVPLSPIARIRATSISRVSSSG